jgi:hypothetical protein
MVEADVLARLFPLLQNGTIVNVITTLVEFGEFSNYF